MYILCPHCKFKTPAGYVLCKHCGNPLPGAALPPPPSPSAPTLIETERPDTGERSQAEAEDEKRRRRQWWPF